MGTTAEKLTYLNTTKGKIKDSINLTGANIGSNDTFRSYAVKLRDGLLDIINNGTATLYNNFPKVSGTGSNISLSNTLEAPMNINKLDGDTLQDGEPTPDTPVEIQSVEGIQAITIGDGTDSDTYEVNLEGKNLFDKADTFTYGYIDSSGNYVSNNTIVLFDSYIEVNGNNYYTFSAKQNLFNLTIVAYDSSKTFIQRNLVSSNKVNTWNLPSNCKYVRLQFNYNNQASSITQEVINNLDLQFEKGNTATSYVPYRSPIKLYNGDYITGTPDNWSIYRENGTYNINTSQISLKESYSNLEYASFPKARDFIGFGSYDRSEVISNKALWTSSTSWNNAENISKISGSANQWDWCLGFTKGTGLTNIQQELTDTKIIYKLATPTTEQITDTYLISQLNALYNAKSKNGQTNISVSGNLPMILEVSALKDEI